MAHQSGRHHLRVGPTTAHCWRRRDGNLATDGAKLIARKNIWLLLLLLLLWRAFWPLLLLLMLQFRQDNGPRRVRPGGLQGCEHGLIAVSQQQLAGAATGIGGAREALLPRYSVLLLLQSRWFVISWLSKVLLTTSQVHPIRCWRQGCR